MSELELDREIERTLLTILLCKDAKISDISKLEALLKEKEVIK